MIQPLTLDHSEKYSRQDLFEKKQVPTNKFNISVICGHFLHFAGDGGTGLGTDSLLSHFANRLRFISTCVSVKNQG